MLPPVATFGKQHAACLSAEAPHRVPTPADEHCRTAFTRWRAGRPSARTRPGRTRACQPDANPGRADRLDAGRFERVALATGSCARPAATDSESGPRGTTLLPNAGRCSSLLRIAVPHGTVGVGYRATGTNAGARVPATTGLHPCSAADSDADRRASQGGVHGQTRDPAQGGHGPDRAVALGDLRAGCSAANPGRRTDGAVAPPLTREASSRTLSQERLRVRLRWCRERAATGTRNAAAARRRGWQGVGGPAGWPDALQAWAREPGGGWRGGAGLGHSPLAGGGPAPRAALARRDRAGSSGIGAVDKQEPQDAEDSGSSGWNGPDRGGQSGAGGNSARRPNAGRPRPSARA